MTGTTTTLAITVAFCLAATAGRAAEGTPAQQEACKPDVYRLCSDVIPDDDRIVACLKRNKQKLSRACYKVFYGR